MARLFDSSYYLATTSLFPDALFGELSYTQSIMVVNVTLRIGIASLLRGPEYVSPSQPQALARRYLIPRR